MKLRTQKSEVSSEKTEPLVAERDCLMPLEGHNFQGKFGTGVAARTLFLVAFVFWLLAPAFAQQPNPEPVYKANAEAVEGVGPGNWTYGADVNLYVNASTGSDSTGNGTSGNPYATIGRALQDVPAFVSQHYIINLAAGTYYEEVDVKNRYFATSALSGLTPASIEIRGDANNPDSYVISGATAAAPTTPARDACVSSSFANVILNGVSLQYANNFAGFYQLGGNSLIISSTFRNIPGTFGIVLRLGAREEIRGNVVMSNVWGGLDAEGISFLNVPLTGNSWWDELGAESLPTGTLTVGVSGSDGEGIVAAEHSMLEIHGNVSLTGPGASAASSTGVLTWEGGEAVLVNASISGFGTDVWADSSSIVYVDTPTLSNAATGVVAKHKATVGWYVSDPTFTSVPTPYSISSGARVVGASGLNLFDGSLDSTGAVSVTAGGTNQDVTLTPSGTGYTILHGKVGIETTSPAAALDVAGAIRSLPVAFSSLPACTAAQEGTQQPVTDSSTNSWGAGISGGGSDHVLAYCDGGTWTVMAK